MRFQKCEDVRQDCVTKVQRCDSVPSSRSHFSEILLIRSKEIALIPNLFNFIRPSRTLVAIDVVFA